MSEYQPRAFRVDMREARHVISYSDGDSAAGGVGAGLWFSPDHPPVAGFLEVPVEIRHLWREQQEREFRYIFELEAFAPLLILADWRNMLMLQCVWTHYIDNDGALAALISGSSSVTSGDCIVGETWRLCDEHQVLPWYERVESKSNPLDGLRGGWTEGPWNSIEQFTVPEALLNLLRAGAKLPECQTGGLPDCQTARDKVFKIYKYSFLLQNN